MYRQIIGYIPSNVIPAVISVMMIYTYTRLLPPAAFGCYSYLFSGALILQSSLFYALPTAVIRFYPGAVQAGQQNGLLKAAYCVFYALCAAVVVIALCAGLLADVPDPYGLPALLALPMLLFRSLVQLNQAINRSANSMGRYNTIECSQAVLGLCLGLAALLLIGPKAEAIVVGLMIAAVICVLMDLRLLAVPFRRHAGRLDKAELGRLVDFSWPMVTVAATLMIMQNSDRILLGSIGGAQMLGIFAVAYNLVERPTTLICSAISNVTYPLAVQVLTHQGIGAAGIQAGQNALVLLAVGLPACAGLALTADYTAIALVGPAFRDGVATLIPIMSFTALARCLRSHFINHAFHLAARPLQMMWIYVPATIVNVGLNLYAVPRFGILGAAWTAFACQWATVVAGWFVGTSLFPVQLPARDILAAVVAVIPMIAGLTYIRFQLNAIGLVEAILLGSSLYIVSAAAMNVGGARTAATAAVRSRMRRRNAMLAG